MISIHDVMVGDFLQNTNGNVGKVVGIELYDGAIDEYDVAMRYSDNSTCYSSPKLLQPIPLTPAILEKNGWEKHEGIYVLKSQPRMGWYPKTGQIIIDYHTFVITVEFVHQLQHIMKMVGIEQEIQTC